MAFEETKELREKINPMRQEQRLRPSFEEPTVPVELYPESHSMIHSIVVDSFFRQNAHNRDIASVRSANKVCFNMAVFLRCGAKQNSKDLHFCLDTGRSTYDTYDRCQGVVERALCLAIGPSGVHSCAELAPSQHGHPFNKRDVCPYCQAGHRGHDMRRFRKRCLEAEFEHPMHYKTWAAMHEGKYMYMTSTQEEHVLTLPSAAQALHYRTFKNVQENELLRIQNQDVTKPQAELLKTIRAEHDRNKLLAPRTITSTIGSARTARFTNINCEHPAMNLSCGAVGFGRHYCHNRIPQEASDTPCLNIVHNVKCGALGIRGIHYCMQLAPTDPLHPWNAKAPVCSMCNLVHDDIDQDCTLNGPVPTMAKWMAAKDGQQLEPLFLTRRHRVWMDKVAQFRADKAYLFTNQARDIRYTIDDIDNQGLTEEEEVFLTEVNYVTTRRSYLRRAKPKRTPVTEMEVDLPDYDDIAQPEAIANEPAMENNVVTPDSGYGTLEEELDGGESRSPYPDVPEKEPVTPLQYTHAQSLENASKITTTDIQQTPLPPVPMDTTEHLPSNGGPELMDTTEAAPLESNIPVIISAPRSISQRRTSRPPPLLNLATRPTWLNIPEVEEPRDRSSRPEPWKFNLPPIRESYTVPTRTTVTNSTVTNPQYFSSSTSPAVTPSRFADPTITTRKSNGHQWASAMWGPDSDPKGVVYKTDSRFLKRRAKIWHVYHAKRTNAKKANRSRPNGIPFRLYQQQQQNISQAMHTPTCECYKAGHPRRNKSMPSQPTHKLYKLRERFSKMNVDDDDVEMHEYDDLMC
jgi:hypothetical protein